MTKTVALVGMAQTTRHLAPWDDTSIEIWTLNESVAKRFGYVRRVSRHFQLHPKWNYSRETNQNDPEHWDWMKSRKPVSEGGFPIYMQDIDPEVPASVKYPYEEICHKYKVTPEADQQDHWREFTSTFPYMLAMALYEDFDRIEIYGFEMGSETEYAYQRPCVHLWLGIARGLYLATGKPEIYLPDGSALLGWGSQRYGYDMILDVNPMELEINRKKFEQRTEEIKGIMSQKQGAQDLLREQIKGIQAKYGERIKAIQAKKIDPKLTQKRIMQIDGQARAEIVPLTAQLNQLEQEKLDLFGQLNHTGGLADAYRMVGNSLAAQKPGMVKGPQLMIKKTNA